MCFHAQSERAEGRVPVLSGGKFRHSGLGGHCEVHCGFD